MASDCLNVVSNIKNLSLVFNDYSVILQEVRTLLKINLYLDVVHVTRNINGATHAIAHLAVKHRLSNFWRKDVPSNTWHAIKTDMLLLM